MDPLPGPNPVHTATLVRPLTQYRAPLDVSDTAENRAEGIDTKRSGQEEDGGEEEVRGENGAGPAMED